MDKEFIEIHTKNGKPTGEKLLKSKIHKEGLFHATVHLWIFCCKDEILIQKRSKNKKINPGIWDVSVAGHIKYQEDFIDAVIRESIEETGVLINKNKLKKIGVFFNEEIYNNFIDREFHHTYIYNAERNKINLDFKNNEVDQLKFITYNEMKYLINNSNEYFIGSNKNYYKCVLEAINTSI